MEVDLRTGFVKQPTFADLARLEKKPIHARPIIRDAEVYWNSFESTWLKGPIDEVTNRGFLAQQRRAVQQAAINQGKRTGQPTSHIVGNMDRAFQKPLQLDSDVHETWHHGMPGNYANPAPQADFAGAAHAGMTQEEYARWLAEQIARATRNATNGSAFGEATTAAPTRTERVRAAAETARAYGIPLTGVGESMLGAGMLATDAVGAAGSGIGAVGSGIATGVGAVGSGIATGASAVGSAAATGVGAAATGLGALGRFATEVGGGLAWTYGEGVKLVGELGYEALKAGTRVVDRAGSAVVEAPALLARGIGRGIAGAARGIRDGRGFLDQVGLAVADAEGDAEREDPR